MYGFLSFRRDGMIIWEVGYSEGVIDRIRHSMEKLPLESGEYFIYVSA